MLKCAIALILLTVCNFGASNCEEGNDVKQSVKVVIIGAGASGIAAASKLLEKGFTNVKIVEAQDRIGGRVYTTKFGEYQVDLGGQWVEGEEGNVVFQLAHPFDLLDRRRDYVASVQNEYYNSAGILMSEEIGKKITDFYFKDVFNIQLTNDTTNESVGHYIVRAFEKRFKDDPEIYNDRDKYLHYLELSRIGAESAPTWFNVSAKGSEKYRECEGDPLVNWKTGGYSTILDILMKRYPDPTKELPVLNNTIFNSEVNSIDYSNKSEGSPIAIRTSKGEKYEADHVIVAIPLGILKEKYKTLFNPPLPEDKALAIETLGYGCVGKVYLLFEEAFWKVPEGDQRMLSFALFWNDEDKKIIESDPEKHWLLAASHIVSVEHKPKLLEMWLAGKHTRTMETLADEKVFNHVLETLDRFLAKRYNVTKPIGIRRTGWCTNPHFKGTYSYASVQAQAQKVDQINLESPLTPEDLKVVFAGEASHIDRFSTVDGAIDAGWKAANRLINRYDAAQLSRFSSLR